MAPGLVSGGDIFDEIRSAAARVAERARFIEIDAVALEALADSLAEDASAPTELDPAHHHLGEDATTLGFVITLNAINFGSGWFPHVHKRPGHSGYRTIATALKERFDARGAFSADELAQLDAGAVAELLGQPFARDPELDELLGHFATALRDLGVWLERRHAGRFAGPIEEAAGSAARLVGILAEMPLYRDVSHYDGFAVPFYKRAQITASDLASAFAGEGWGAFGDHARLTIFADNLVPHTLRHYGVLRYADTLAGRIDREELIAPGSLEEVEIRALGLHAVEGIVAKLRAAGIADASAGRIDHILWARGQSPEIKANPRHRARTTWY